MLKVKENVEMIKEIRKYIIDSLKSRNVTTAHADLAKIVLMYDYEESMYDTKCRWIATTQIKTDVSKE